MSRSSLQLRVRTIEWSIHALVSLRVAHAGSCIRIAHLLILYTVLREVVLAVVVLGKREHLLWSLVGGDASLRVILNRVTFLLK